MGLIMNELVSNALKYAFPENRPGRINIELTSHSIDDFVFTVRDDGVGMKEDVDQKTTNSLGLKLVHTLAMQLQGRVEVDREGGTAFSIIRGPS